MIFAHSIGSRRYTFSSLRELLAKATPLRSGDVLAGVAAGSAEERVAAQCALADLPLKHFCDEQVVPYETDEVTRLIVDTHDAEAFAPVRSLTVGELRNWLLGDEATPEQHCLARAGTYAGDGRGDSQADARAGPDCGGDEKCAWSRAFAPRWGLPGRLSARLQPNHPADDAAGHRGIDSGWAADGLGRRGGGHQSRGRQH